MSTEQETEEQVQTKAKEPEFVTCPCCGKPTLVKPVNVKPPLLDQYMACIMSGVPFSHTYPVYGGRMQITVSQLDQTFSDKLRNVDRVLAEWESTLQDKFDQGQELGTLMRLYCSIPEVKIESGAAEKSFQPAAVVSDMCDAIVAKKQSYAQTDTEPTYLELCEFIQKQLEIVRSTNTSAGIPLAIIMGVVEAHNQLYTILVTSGFDANFWEGIELA